MDVEQTLQAMVRLLYEAALDPALWKQFLRMFAEAVRSPTAALVMHDFKDGRARVSASTYADSYWEKLYADHYAACNVWLSNPDPSLFSPGLVITSQERLADHELTRTEFYNDFLRPQDLFYSFGGTIRRDGSLRSYLTTLRSSSAGAFEEPEIATLQFLMPHLNCALRVHSHVSCLEARLNASAAALDCFPCGVVLLDSRQRPVLINRAAHRIFDQRDGLSLTRDGIAAVTHALSEAIRRLVHAATADVAGVQPGSEGGGAVSVTRPSLRRPYEVLVVPLPAHSRLAEAPTAVAVVFVSDPEYQPASDPEVFRRLYGLTKAEARMAAALVGGKTLQLAAQEFGISVHTARTQVKSILSKPQTGSQSQLIRLLMNCPARFSVQPDYFLPHTLNG